MLIWNACNWDEPPYSFPFGADHLCIQGNSLGFSRGKALYATDLTHISSFIFMDNENQTAVAGSSLGHAFVRNRHNR